MLGQLILAKLQSLIVEDGPRFINDLFVAIGVCFIVYLWINFIVHKIKEKIVSQTLETNTYTLKLAHIVGIMIFIVLMVFNLLIGLKIMGINTGVVMGALVIAIGMWFENTIGNMIAWLVLLTNEKIKVWKKFKLLWSYNELVTVEWFTIRYTVLRTLYKQKFIIPNMDLLATPIESKRYEEKLRGKLSISILRKWDLNTIKKVIIDTINKHDHVIDKEKTLIIVDDFSERWYSLTAYYYFSPLNKKLQFTLNSEISLELKKTLHENNVLIGAYPRQVRRSEIQ